MGAVMSAERAPSNNAQPINLIAYGQEIQIDVEDGSADVVLTIRTFSNTYATALADAIRKQMLSNTSISIVAPDCKAREESAA